MLLMTCALLWPSKGALPTNSSQVSTPMHHRSTVQSQVFLSMISGGAQSRVPQKVDLTSCTTADQPKSHTFAMPLERTMFSGLMSRWAMEFSCRYISAWMMSLRKSTACLRGRAPTQFWQSKRVPPLMYSRTRQKASFSYRKAQNLTMVGWSSEECNLTYSMNCRTILNYFSFCFYTFLRATKKPVQMCLPRQTSPNLPLPSTRPNQNPWTICPFRLLREFERVLSWLSVCLIFRQQVVLVFLRVLWRGLDPMRVSQLGGLVVLVILLIMLFWPGLALPKWPLLSGESSSLERVIKLLFNLSVKLVSVSWGSSTKDRLGSYFMLIFLGGEPEVVVEAIDPAAMGWDGRWGQLVMACKLIGGILMGDYSEYFFGSGRWQDLRTGLQFSVQPVSSRLSSCLDTDRLVPKAPFPLLISVLIYAFLFLSPWCPSPLSILSAPKQSWPPLAFTIFSTPSILDCSCWIDWANFIIAGEVGAVKSCSLSACLCASLACFWWVVQKLYVFLMRGCEPL